MKGRRVVRRGIEGGEDGGEKGSEERDRGGRGWRGEG